MLASRVTSLARICMHCSTTRAFWMAQSVSRAVALAYAARDVSRCSTTFFHSAEASLGSTVFTLGFAGAASRHMRRLCLPSWNTSLSRRDWYPWAAHEEPLERRSFEIEIERVVTVGLAVQFHLQVVEPRRPAARKQCAKIDGFAILRHWNFQFVLLPVRDAFRGSIPQIDECQGAGFPLAIHPPPEAGIPVHVLDRK